ncbi:MAG: hypothetical protein NVSMB39_3640 [Candidatus Saccharimonadales bacterium]
MPGLAVKATDLLMAAFEKILYRTSGMNHPDLEDLRNEILQEWRQTFMAMRQAAEEVAEQISREQGIIVRFNIHKYRWDKMADAIKTLKQLEPGDSGSPNGAERMIRRAEAIRETQRHR